MAKMMAMTIKEKIEMIEKEFAQEQDWESKYKLIIEKGKRLSDLSDEFKTEDNLIKGCQSQVWLVARLDPQTKNILLVGDSDALIVKGLVAVLLEIFNNQPPAEVLKADLNFFERIGFKNHLSPSRSNGFSAMIKQIFNYAVAFNYLNNKNN